MGGQDSMVSGPPAVLLDQIIDCLCIDFCEAELACQHCYDLAGNPPRWVRRVDLVGNPPEERLVDSCSARGCGEKDELVEGDRIFLPLGRSGNRSASPGGRSSGSGARSAASAAGRSRRSGSVPLLLLSWSGASQILVTGS